jgi:predicted hotdog family 3-hydroxylacyl-ACP dehydratase
LPTKTLNLDARAQAKVRVLPWLAATLSAGSFHQSPTALQAHPGAGNPELVPEGALQAEVGAEVAWNQLLLVHGGVFGVRQNDTIVTPSTASGSSKRYVNTGAGQSIGAELRLTHHFADFIEGWGTYSYSVATSIDPDTHKTSLSSNDQTHVFGVGVAVHAPWDLTISGRYFYATGQLYTPVLDSVYLASSNSYTPIEGAALSARMPDTQELDLRIEKSWQLVPVSLLTYLEVRNVTGAANAAESNVYSIDYTQATYRTTVPFLPMLGVRVTY